MARRLSMWCTACWALSLTAAACGDDGVASTDGTAGSPSGGMGGSGGQGGSKDYANDALKVEVCKTWVPPTNATAGCTKCICEEDAAVVLQCDGSCWDLIDCAQDKCGDAPAANKQACTQTMCSSAIGVAVTSGVVGVAQTVSALLSGSKCGSSCAED